MACTKADSQLEESDWMSTFTTMKDEVTAPSFCLKNLTWDLGVICFHTLLMGLNWKRAGDTNLALVLHVGREQKVLTPSDTGRPWTAWTSIQHLSESLESVTSYAPGATISQAEDTTHRCSCLGPTRFNNAFSNCNLPCKEPAWLLNARKVMASKSDVSMGLQEVKAFGLRIIPTVKEREKPSVATTENSLLRWAAASPFTMLSSSSLELAST
mmetsp:Transcript_11733/g.31858  ORF Transcript_11733/g.31858 Transcript_11733/m.31858 type:complete len:213 (-) Transcript_11733:1247-1885(-)